MILSYKNLMLFSTSSTWQSREWKRGSVIHHLHISDFYAFHFTLTWTLLQGWLHFWCLTANGFETPLLPLLFLLCIWAGWQESLVAFSTDASRRFKPSPRCGHPTASVATIQTKSVSFHCSQDILNLIRRPAPISLEISIM